MCFNNPRALAFQFTFFNMKYWEMIGEEGGNYASLNNIGFCVTKDVIDQSCQPLMNSSGEGSNW